MVMDKKVEELSHKQAAQLRNEHIGFIFQTFNLLPVYTVFENVEFPLLLLGLSAAERKRRVMEALEWVRLAESENPSQARPEKLARSGASDLAQRRGALLRLRGHHLDPGPLPGN
jgi:putative ABC transport system ATP-binding protein